MSVTIADVESLDATGWSQMDQAVKEEALERAKRLLDNQFSDKVATLPTFVGSRDDGLKLLTAHLIELAQGGEAQSESSEGGSVTYNTVTGEPLDSLSETRYGREFQDFYLRDRLGIGVIRSR
jgi:hypothetical protein